MHFLQDSIVVSYVWGSVFGENPPGIGQISKHQIPGQKNLLCLYTSLFLNFTLAIVFLIFDAFKLKENKSYVYDSKYCLALSLFLLT